MIRGERLLFREVSLSLAPGEAIVLRGPNGAGKTTLLRILAGLTQAETGTIDRNAPHQ
ncbi:MAG TPA: cytochrome c biogenesis ATP-binding export protein CcmA, partial [Hyphomonas sp.]|nr:cytochrome c biogenesis ATP-binding export protein CcmA [Hyphomonas sp.]